MDDDDDLPQMTLDSRVQGNTVTSNIFTDIENKLDACQNTGIYAGI